MGWLVVVLFWLNWVGILDSLLHFPPNISSNFSKIFSGSFPLSLVPIGLTLWVVGGGLIGRVSSKGNFFLSLVPDWFLLWSVGGGFVDSKFNFPLWFVSVWLILLVVGGGLVILGDSNGNFPLSFGLGLVIDWMVGCGLDGLVGGGDFPFALVLD